MAVKFWWGLQWFCGLPLAGWSFYNIYPPCLWTWYLLQCLQCLSLHSTSLPPFWLELFLGFFLRLQWIWSFPWFFSSYMLSACAVFGVVHRRLLCAMTWLVACWEHTFLRSLDSPPQHHFAGLSSVSLQPFLLYCPSFQMRLTSQPPTLSWSHKSYETPSGQDQHEPLNLWQLKTVLKSGFPGRACTSGVGCFRGQAMYFRCRALA